LTTLLTAVDWSETWSGLGACVSYVALGVVILIVGYVITDVLTPGNLSHLICNDRNVNATIVASTNLIAVASIIVMAIWTTHEDFGTGLVTTAVFGFAGVVLLAIVDFIVDKLTPGDLPTIVTGQGFHPASVFLGVTHVIVGLLIAVSIA